MEYHTMIEQVGNKICHTMAEEVTKVCHTTIGEVTKICHTMAGEMIRTVVVATMSKVATETNKAEDLIHRVVYTITKDTILTIAVYMDKNFKEEEIMAMASIQ